MNTERALNAGRDVISLRRTSLAPATIKSLMLTRNVLMLEKDISKVKGVLRK